MENEMNTVPLADVFEIGLDRNAANYAALTPLTFIQRAAAVYPEHTAVVYGEVRRSWADTYGRCCRLASALELRGIGKGDTVAVIASNIPEIFEAHFGVPMIGAVLNTLNTRLDAEALAFTLQHGEAKALLVDPEFANVAERAVHISGLKMLVVDIEDASFEGGRRIGQITYEQLLAEGDPRYAWAPPGDEWEAIALNYTSGTTGDPKGVVYHHRGAYLNAVSNVLSWGMGQHPVYLWTLPMFHCNGWCFPWTLAAVAGTNVCMRHVRADAIFNAIREQRVSHFCAAPIVLNLLNNAPAALKENIVQKVKAMTAGSAPPAPVIEGMERMGFEVTQVYGLTETYGPRVVSAWHEAWNEKPLEEKARLKARQGVRSPMLDGLMVADPVTMEPVPRDGATMGEIMMRGNLVMKGYLKNPSATAATFSGGWLHSGDLAVWHADGYAEIKDRSKDIIISGGENISSLEVEEVFYRHPAVLEAAVVARPDAKWGETPCAFVTLKDGAVTTEDELILFCREQMARFKVPRTVVLGPLPKTVTGKVKKFALREQARALGSLS
jgi:fatty-acyl-CoA synthase